MLKRSPKLKLQSVTLHLTCALATHRHPIGGSASLKRRSWGDRKGQTAAKSRMRWGEKVRCQVRMLEVDTFTPSSRGIFRQLNLSQRLKALQKCFQSRLSQTEALPYTLIVSVVKNPLVMTPIHMTYKKASQFPYYDYIFLKPVLTLLSPTFAAIRTAHTESETFCLKSPCIEQIR